MLDHFEKERHVEGGRLPRQAFERSLDHLRILPTRKGPARELACLLRDVERHGALGAGFQARKRPQGGPRPQVHHVVPLGQLGGKTVAGLVFEAEALGSRPLGRVTLGNAHGKITTGLPRASIPARREGGYGVGETSAGAPGPGEGVFSSSLAKSSGVLGSLSTAQVETRTASSNPGTRVNTPAEDPSLR